MIFFRRLEVRKHVWTRTDIPLFRDELPPQLYADTYKSTRPVVVIVAPGGRRRLYASRHAARLRDIGELASAVVVKQKIRAVTGDEQIQVAIVVELCHAQAVAAGSRRPAERVYPQLMGDIHEAVGVVAVQSVQSSILIRGEHVEAVVLVVIEPYRAHGFARIVDTHILCDSDEAIPFVVEQHVRRVPKRDKQIHPAVVVEIDPGDLARLTLHIHAKIFGLKSPHAAARVSGRSSIFRLAPTSTNVP